MVLQVCIIQLAISLTARGNLTHLVCECEQTENTVAISYFLC